MAIRISKFTPNEIAVMRALYRRDKPSTIREIAEEITGKKANCFSSGYRTTTVTLSGLVRRGFVNRDDKSKNPIFTPAKNICQLLQDEFTELAQNLLGSLPRGFKTAIARAVKRVKY